MIKWKKKSDIVVEKHERDQLKSKRGKNKGKKFTTLSNKEKDELLEMLAEQAGLL